MAEESGVNVPVAPSVQPNTPAPAGSPQQSSRARWLLLGGVAGLIVGVIIGVLAGLFLFRATGVEAKARLLPVSTRLDKHTITPGYTLLITNESKTPLRLALTVTMNGQDKTFAPVVDGGRFYRITGLAPHDAVTIESEGYDPLHLDIE
ncbi:MAG: hypothetical protein ABSA67_18510 [Candidatus Brocadiia bacterium]